MPPLSIIPVFFLDVMLCLLAIALSAYGTAVDE